MIIREFHYPQDYNPALELWKNSGEGIGIGFSDQPEEIEKKLLRDPDLFLVAEENNTIIGTVIGGFDGRRGMIYHLAVASSHQQKGLGGLLLNQVELRLAAKGCRKAYLLVKKGNEAVVDFYNHRGWGAMENISIFGKNLIP